MADHDRQSFLPSSSAAEYDAFGGRPRPRPGTFARHRTRRFSRSCSVRFRRSAAVSLESDGTGGNSGAGVRAFPPATSSSMPAAAAAACRMPMSSSRLSAVTTHERSPSLTAEAAAGSDGKRGVAAAPADRRAANTRRRSSFFWTSCERSSRATRRSAPSLPESLPLLQHAVRRNDAAMSTGRPSFRRRALDSQHCHRVRMTLREVRTPAEVMRAERGGGHRPRMWRGTFFC